MILPYFCANCGNVFRTGMYKEEQELVRDKNTPEEEKELCLLYDDICPNCGAPACLFREWLVCEIRRRWGRKKR